MMHAQIKVTFFDSANEKIESDILDCYGREVNCEEFIIPKDATSVVVCYTNEYRNCENCC